MHAFRRSRDGYRARLAPVERQALASVVDDVLALLGGSRAVDGDVADGVGDLPALRIAEVVVAPSDPAVARLLPDASRDDPDLAAEFRRLTQDDLRAAKAASLDLLRTTLLAQVPGAEDDELVVGRADGGRVAAALTDVRLVLAERLGLRTDEDAEALHVELERVSGRRPDDDRRRALAELYDALTWWQETLVVALVGDLPGGSA